MKTKVFFLKSGVAHGFAYLAESIVELNQRDAEYLIAKGIAVKVTEPFTELPKSFPLREVFIENGLYSVEIIEKCHESMTIKNGIDVISVNAIYQAWLKKKFNYKK